MSDLITGYNDLSAAIGTLSSVEVTIVAEIQALQAQVANGSPVTGDQLDALASEVSGITAGFQAPFGTNSGGGTSTSTSTSTGTATATDTSTATATATSS